MFIDISGAWMYIYEKLCSVTEEYNSVEAVKLTSITGVKVDYEDSEITFYVSGRLSPIFWDLGESQNKKVNTFYNVGIPFLEKLESLGICPMMLTNLTRVPIFSSPAEPQRAPS